jgi:hypothetical protein
MISFGEFYRRHGTATSRTSRAGQATVSRNSRIGGAAEKIKMLAKQKSGDSVMSGHFQALTSTIGSIDVPNDSTAMAGAARA